MGRLRVPFCMHRTGWLLVLLCVVLGVGMGGWQLGFPEGALFLASLLLHEAGHMLAAAFLGVPVREFGLELRGAYVRRAYATRRRGKRASARSVGHPGESVRRRRGSTSSPGTCELLSGGPEYLTSGQHVGVSS